MSIVAILPVAGIAVANASLESAGFGPQTFRAPLYTGASPTHGIMHAWSDAALAAAVKALPGVTYDESEGSPSTRAATLIAAAGARWGARAPRLPDTGTVMPGELYRYGLGPRSRLWSVIQQHDRGVFGGDPAQYPALIRRARVPGRADPWQQPIDQYDAYKLINAFTGLPDECTYNGQRWRVSQADGAGNNVWAPGTFGWAIVE